jgi:O-acetyl-ADP-ribose deacetylase (regulator of RNase III)
MATIFTKGDLFDTDGIRAYAFGTNAEGTMDTGIAVAVRKRFPKVGELLVARAKAGKLALGDVVEHRENGETVFALVLQEAETKKAKFATLTKAAQKLVELATAAKLERVGLFHPGLGRAGLEWQRIKSVLTEIGDETDVAIVVFEQFVRKKPAPPPE